MDWNHQNIEAQNGKSTSACGGQQADRHLRSKDLLIDHINSKHSYAVEIKLDHKSFGQTSVSDRAVENLEQTLKPYIEEDRRSSYGRFLKRSMDVFGALLGLIALAPLMLLIMILIRLSSSGPVIYSQERVGKGGKSFKILKFRSMVMATDCKKESLEPENGMGASVVTVTGESQVTPIGRILRKYNLDELPQLYNVLKGDMSIVGPRPALPEEVFQCWKPWCAKRLSVDQGLTCLWQISDRKRISFDRWMELDLEYIRNWSIWLDIKIIFRTILLVFTGRGAI